MILAQLLVLLCRTNKKTILIAAVVKLVDAYDSKSYGSNPMSVRFRPAAHKIRPILGGFFICKLFFCTPDFFFQFFNPVFYLLIGRVYF